MAEELIELGESEARGASAPVLLRTAVGAVGAMRGGAPAIRREPYLAGRPTLGQESAPFEGDLVGYLSERLDAAVGLISDVSDVPLGLMRSGDLLGFVRIAEVLQDVPMFAEAAAQAVLIGEAVLGLGISVSGETPQNLARIVEGMRTALVDATSEAELTRAYANGKQSLVNGAPESMRADLENVLGASTEGRRAERSDAGPSGTEKALAIAVPVAVAVGIVALVATS